MRRKGKEEKKEGEIWITVRINVRKSPDEWLSGIFVFVFYEFWIGKAGDVGWSQIAHEFEWPIKKSVM